MFVPCVHPRSLTVRPPTTQLISCPRCNYQGPSLGMHHRLEWYYLLLLVIPYVGIVPLLLLLSYLGGRIQATCPRCLIHRGLTPYTGEHSSGAMDIWRRAAENDARIVKHNGRFIGGVSLAIVLGIGGLVLVSLASSR